MLKLLTVLVLIAMFSVDVNSQYILPTYRPPPRRPIIIRTVRDVDREQPKWLYEGDVPRAPATGEHPVLPPYIDDIKMDPNRRYARSLDSPSAKRYGGGGSTSSRSRNTGATHPGYNRRNARSLHRTFPSERPFSPYPRPPPTPRPRYPIYVA
ncbi:unnamed protein product [Leptosia nina]|uniref:Lebocin n=1 Tax=Leptosia nina TaxID=320188 RepID=A0AAV1J770_9NEOP